MTCDAYQDLVAAHVDGQLSATELQEVDAHLQSCASCRERYAEEQQFQRAFASRRILLVTPPDVLTRLQEALVHESTPAASWRQRLFAHRGSLFSFLFSHRWATAAVLLALSLPYWWLPTAQPDLFVSAVEEYELATTDQRVFTYVMRDSQKLAHAFNTSGRLDFITHVLDLRSAGYRIRGGNIIDLNGHPTAVTVYSGSEADLVCLRQRGVLPPLPPGAMKVGRD